MENIHNVTEIAELKIVLHSCWIVDYSRISFTNDIKVKLKIGVWKCGEKHIDTRTIRKLLNRNQAIRNWPK